MLTGAIVCLLPRTSSGNPEDEKHTRRDITYQVFSGKVCNWQTNSSQETRLFGASMRNKLVKELQTASRESGSRKNPASADYLKDKRGGSRQQVLLKKQPRKSHANQYLHPLRVPLTPESLWLLTYWCTCLLLLLNSSLTATARGFYHKQLYPHTI